MVVEQVVLDFTKIGIGNPLVQALLAAVIRSFAGWLENSLEDGKIQDYELKKLFATMFRIIPQALGLSALVGPSGTIGAFFTDWVFVKLSNSLKKEQGF